MSNDISKTKQDAWFREHYKTLKNLNEYIIDSCLKEQDKESTIFDTHQHIQIILDTWENFPTEESREHTLHDLLLEAGGLFLQNEICTPQEKNNDIAARLLEEALNLGKVAYPTAIHQPMLATNTSLGMALLQNDKKKDAVEALQRALYIGEQLESEAKNAYIEISDQEFISCMITTCEALAVLAKDESITKSINLYKRAITYYQLGNMDSDAFDDMIEVLKTIGSLALEREGEIEDDVLEHVELGVLLLGNHLNQDTPELIPLLILLHKIYDRRNESEKSKAVADRISSLIDVKKAI